MPYVPAVQAPYTTSLPRHGNIRKLVPTPTIRAEASLTEGCVELSKSQGAVAIIVIKSQEIAW